MAGCLLLLLLATVALVLIILTVMTISEYFHTHPKSKICSLHIFVCLFKFVLFTFGYVFISYFLFCIFAFSLSRLYFWCLFFLTSQEFCCILVIPYDSYAFIFKIRLFSLVCLLIFRRIILIGIDFVVLFLLFLILLLR